MGRPIDKITLRGFKSIGTLEEFPLTSLNVLIDANGAGKSNFVEFFQMLRAMADEAFQNYVLESGGSDGFLFLGPKVTSEISCRVDFGRNWYSHTLQPTASGSLILGAETTGYGDSSSTVSGLKESEMKSRKDEKSLQNASWWGVGRYVYESISSWTVYHFHDTSSQAPMRRDQSLQDWSRFRHDAANIAPFLYELKKEEPGSYELIRDTVRLIAPFFDDFLLRPERKVQRSRFDWNGSRREATSLFNRIISQTVRFGSSVLPRPFLSPTLQQRSLSMSRNSDSTPTPSRPSLT